MRVYVCVKHVPDTAANIKVVGGSGFDESVKFIVNPYDEYAIGEASQLVKKEGGEVVIVTLGKASAMTTVRAALAIGGDRGILIKTDKQFVESDETALILKKAIEEDGGADMIFAGKQAADSEGMQTCYRLAANLGMPVATEVVGFSYADGKAVVEREIGGGEREVIEMTAPCVVGATKGLNEVKYPKLPDIMKAKKKPVNEMDAGSLKVDAPGLVEFVSLEQVPERSNAKMLEGSVTEAVDALVKLLRDEAKVLD